MQKLITKYNVPSAAERFKVELFHLLVCFGQLHRTYRKIEPHDPGDFIVRDETGTHMFEIVTIFGNREAYRVIEAYFEKLFQHGRPREERIHLITSFEENMDKLKELLITKMWEKNEKDYFRCHDYKTANLLLATAEYDKEKAQFHGSSPWPAGVQEVVARKNFTRCYVLDYTVARAEVFDMERELLAYDEYLRESGAAYGRRKGGEAPDL